MILGIVWIPVMKGMGNVLYQYLQAVQGLLAPAIAAAFVMGVFWKRTSGAGGLAGLLTGFTLGMFRLVLNILIGGKASLVVSAEKAKRALESVAPDQISLWTKNIGDMLATKEVTSAPAGAIRESLTAAQQALAGRRPQHRAGHLQPGPGQGGHGRAVHATARPAVYAGRHQLAALHRRPVHSLHCGDDRGQFVDQAANLGANALHVRSATPEEKAATRASWNGWDILHSAIILGIIIAFYVYFWKR